ncbi:hypothetical protein ACFV9C_38510 [Kribbella sp. NPDC059898]|uniref:hypothetical protein n=1 Tax=Kribbella sp. NPDC059898 TaxID=3346995 RepID=UPI003649F924
MEDDEEDVVDLGRPPAPRWLRIGVRIGVGLAVVALLVIALRPWSAPTSSLVVPSVTPPGVGLPTPSTRSWPTVAGAGDSNAEVPIVSSVPSPTRTGIQVLLGGERLRTVDFDAGRVVTLAGLRSGEYAAVLGGPKGTYATASTCEASGSRILRIGADQRVSAAGTLPRTGSVLTAGGQAWIVSYPDEAGQPYGTVVPLGGGRQVRLPVGFYPYDVVGTTLVGLLQPDPSAPPADLLLVEAATGHIRARLGRDAAPIATGNGQVVWTSGCDATSDQPCILHRLSVATGNINRFRLPRPAGAGIVSPDGSRPAFILQRATTDPRYEGRPLPPSDIAVMHFDSGRLEIVPGIEMPAKSSPGLAFSADGHWLAIALNAGNRVRLLAWRSGLARPYETGAVPAQVLGTPTIVPLPTRSG